MAHWQRGQLIVLTGKMRLQRDLLMDRIRAVDWGVVDSPTPQSVLVVGGDNPLQTTTRKLKDARLARCTIIREETFFRQLVMEERAKGIVYQEPKVAVDRTIVSDGVATTDLRPKDTWASPKAASKRKVEHQQMQEQAERDRARAALEIPGKVDDIDELLEDF